MKGRTLILATLITIHGAGLANYPTDFKRLFPVIEARAEEARTSKRVPPGGRVESADGMVSVQFNRFVGHRPGVDPKNPDKKAMIPYASVTVFVDMKNINSVPAHFEFSVGSPVDIKYKDSIYSLELFSVDAKTAEISITKEPKVHP